MQPLVWIWFQNRQRVQFDLPRKLWGNNAVATARSQCKPSFYLVRYRVAQRPADPEFISDRIARNVKSYVGLPILRHIVRELEFGGAEGPPRKTAHVQSMDAGRAEHTISYRIISYHFISNHIISLYIAPCQNKNHHITSEQTKSHHTILTHIIAYHITSHHINSYHIIKSHQTFSNHIKSYVPVILA